MGTNLGVDYTLPSLVSGLHVHRWIGYLRRGVLSRYTLYVYSLDLGSFIDGMTYENEIYIFFPIFNIMFHTVRQ